MFNLLRFLVIVVLFFSCQFKNPDKEGYLRKDLYQIICLHPIKGYKKFIVSKNTWKYPMYNNSNTWMFIDINGNKVVSTLGCYTDTSLKIKVKK